MKIAPVCVSPTTRSTRRSLKAGIGLVSLLGTLIVSPRGDLAAFFDGHLAQAAEDDAKVAAKAKLTEGPRLMDAGDYAQALNDFEEAYKLVPSPKIFF